MTLSDYELLRLEKIKRNNDRLADLGLLDLKSKITTKKSQLKKQKPHADRSNKPTRSTRSTTTLDDKGRRSSRRLKRKPALFEPSFDDFFDATADKVRTPRKIHGPTKIARTSTSKFKCEIPMNVASSPLSTKEKKLMENKMDSDFLEKFEDYLTNVDECSEQNRRNVIRQITKLHYGEGIRYESKAYGWPEDCYFMKGTKIGPQDDILHLMETGQQCEDKWGKDHGNGWLLSHPLKKLYMFQQYHLSKK